VPNLYRKKDFSKQLQAFDLRKDSFLDQAGRLKSHFAALDA
jgi:hypothetical protein